MEPEEVMKEGLESHCSIPEIQRNLVNNCPILLPLPRRTYFKQPLEICIPLWLSECGGKGVEGRVVTENRQRIRE